MTLASHWADQSQYLPLTLPATHSFSHRHHWPYISLATPCYGYRQVFNIMSPFPELQSDYLVT